MRAHDQLCPHPGPSQEGLSPAEGQRLGLCMELRLKCWPVSTLGNVLPRPEEKAPAATERGLYSGVAVAPPSSIPGVV